MLGFIGDAIDWAGNAAGKGLDAIGEPFQDFSRVGKNNFNPPAYEVPGVDWGGQPGMADQFSGMAQRGMQQSGGLAGFAGQQAQWDRGPMAGENMDLSQRETDARYGDQNGAIQLAREAAMGQAPSEAAYAMQSGLNQSNAMQTAMAGGARGAAAIAQAQGNAAANVANSNNQAFNEAGRLRAQEMAQARGQYGGLAGQQREQDLNRLQMGNQMSQFNAGLNDQYRMGMLNAANQAGQTQQGWFGAAMSPYNQQAQLDSQKQQLQANEWGQRQAMAAGISQANADQRAGMRDRWMSLGGTSVGMAGSAIGGQQGGGGPKPT